MARADELWMAFAGRESGEMGVHVLGLSDIPVAGERGEAIGIPGRDGTLWIGEGAFDDVRMKADIELDRSADIDAVAAWLTGEGDLVRSDMEDYRWRARVTGGFSLEGGMFAHGQRRATVAFTCEPFRYEARPRELAPITAPKVFRGKGTWRARPVVTVYGSGDIHLTINGATVLFDDVEDHITLDCEAMMAFKDGVNASGKVTILSEDDSWPALTPEENSVNWSGEVERVVIRPNWRWR